MASSGASPLIVADMAMKNEWNEARSDQPLLQIDDPLLKQLPTELREYVKPPSQQQEYVASFAPRCSRALFAL